MNLHLVTEEQLSPIKEDIQEIKKSLLEISKQTQGGTLLTNQEAVKFLNVSSKTLQNYRDKGLIEFIQIGRKVYYSRDAIYQFLESFKVKCFNNKKEGGLL